MTAALRFELDNLHCASCVSRAEAALSAIPGVQAARVNLATHTAEVAGVTADQVADALDQAGYPAHRSSQVYSVAGMNCGSCVARIEKAAHSVPGVLDVQARLPDKSLFVTYLGDNARALEEALAQAGYPLTSEQVEAPRDRAADEIADLKRRFVIAAALTLPVFVVEMGGHLFPPVHHWVHMTIGQTASHWMQMVLTALVLFGPGIGFFRRGFSALARRAPDMDSLVALGAGAAFVFSCVSVLMPGALPTGSAAVYFEAAAVIVTLILLGRWLEARAKARAGDAVRRLLTLAPERAVRVTDAGDEEVAVSDIDVGDRLRLKPGARAAVDGIVISGTSLLDESMLTGEPIPVPKAKGEALSAGTLNGEGALVYRATAVGRATQLARIAALTEAAQATRLPVEALVNWIASWFVPIVLCIAATTFAVWMVFGADPALGPAVVAAVSVLIIACPCAMGLATPMSILVGTGRAAESGVLFQGGDALERLRGVGVVAFDKTGTLTEGQPSVVDIALAEGVERDDVLRYAAAVEAQSEHPLAKAVLRAANARFDGSITDFVAVPGTGARARVEGSHVAVGSADMMVQVKAAIPQDWPALSPDQSAIYVALDGACVARLAISDQVREGAADLVNALHRLGYKTALLSGDRVEVAEHVAAALGLDAAKGALRPEDKVDTIAALRRDYGPVAFVGDGINDAPALASADVGLAVGTANDAAIEAADVVLVAPGLGPVTRAVAISQATLRNIKQNLVWAFGYNVMLIPVAAGVLVPFGGPSLSPMLGAGAMALSSVMVVSNALRLKRVRLSEA